MTSPHDALYRAICAHPDEDTPRLAFADLMDEVGDHRRAHFIRTQIALAALPPEDPDAVAVRRADPDLFTGHAMAHTLPQLPAGYSWTSFEFRRGFPWKAAVVSEAAFGGDGAALFEAAPIQALSVGPRRRANLKQFLTWPGLRYIRRIEFTQTSLAQIELIPFTNCPQTQNLTELAFEFDGITAVGLEALAHAPLFARLTRLDLQANRIPSALVVDSLAAVAEPNRLRHLSLKNSGLTREDAGHLFALPVVQELEHFDLSDNPQLGVEGVQTLAGSGAFRVVRELNLTRTLPGVPGVRALCESSSTTRLTRLDLSANRLGPVATRLLAEALTARALVSLDLSNNPIGDAGVAALAQARSLGSLLELNLQETGLTDAGAIALAQSPALEGLLSLNLSTTVSDQPLGRAAQQALRERFGKHVIL